MLIECIYVTNCWKSHPLWHGRRVGEPWPVETRIFHFSIQYSSKYKLSTSLSNPLVLFHFLTILQRFVILMFNNYFLSTCLLIPLWQKVCRFLHTKHLWFSVDTNWETSTSLHSDTNYPKSADRPHRWRSHFYKTAHTHFRCQLPVQCLWLAINWGFPWPPTHVW